MIVRTYGRRNRAGDLMGGGGPYSPDPTDDEDPFGFRDDTATSSSSQDPFKFLPPPAIAAAPFPFSSQESSSFDPDPVELRPRAKRVRTEPFAASSTTLMEAQEYGEMMEHVDEVNFALDGLRRGQPLRVRRASLLSLLSICGTHHHRRLLRTQGLSKTIIDAILGLGLDDESCSLAAAALFYVLTGDGQEDHLLESPQNIRFLLKLLDPVASTASLEKSRSIGSKLLAMRKDSDSYRDSSKTLDTNCATITAKVLELLVSCKDIKAACLSSGGTERPELSAKWIALLTMEKACLSKISIEDLSGTVRETGGNFKEKLRELGGLDSVFDEVKNCYSVLENWAGQTHATVQERSDDRSFKSLMLLLKCLRIMENATFLSKDNQSHLLEMRVKSNANGRRLFFTELLMNIINILSGFCLRKGSATSSSRKPLILSDEYDCASELDSQADSKENSREIICISTSTDCCSSKWGFLDNRNCSSRFGGSTSCSETATASTNDFQQPKIRLLSSMSSSFSGMSRSSSEEHMPTGRLKAKHAVEERSNWLTDGLHEPRDDEEDPFAFDEDEFLPSKWEVLHGNKISRNRSRKNGKRSRGLDNRSSSKNLENLSVSEDCQQKSNSVDYHDSNGDTSCYNDNEEHRALLSDCLLSAVKVLMNLTNENPTGCKQIAAYGGLETMSSLIAGHFPSFGSSLAFCKKIKDLTSRNIKKENECRLTDQELEFLVAILGLLVNLVEKDGNNRSRLATATISYPASEGFVEESRKDVISLLCCIFLTNQGASETSEEGNALPWDPVVSSYLFPEYNGIKKEGVSTLELLCQKRGLGHSATSRNSLLIYLNIEHKNENDEAALLQGEKEAEKMIVEAYSALLLAFLSTESKCTRDSIASYLPNNNLAILVPVLERFVAFHMTLNMISPDTHKVVTEVIESCRVP